MKKHILDITIEFNWEKNFISCGPVGYDLDDGKSDIDACDDWKLTACISNVGMVNIACVTQEAENEFSWWLKKNITSNTILKMGVCESSKDAKQQINVLLSTLRMRSIEQ